MKPSMNIRAFTLIELLVVVTIIVVLLALLTPALDKAVYQAELLVCAGNVRALGQAASEYAAGSARRYPPRFIAQGKQPHWLVQNVGGPNDERPALRPYVSMKAFQDPFTPRLDYEVLPKGVDAYTPYKLWYSWRYVTQPGQTRMGDRFSWTSTVTKMEHTFNVLAGDYSEFNTPSLVSNHQDREGRMYRVLDDNTTTPWASNLRITIGRWESDDGVRGTFDLNFAFQDGSVGRLSDLPSDDMDHTVRVPESATSTDDAGWYTLLPSSD